MTLVQSKNQESDCDCKDSVRNVCRTGSNSSGFSYSNSWNAELKAPVIIAVTSKTSNQAQGTRHGTSLYRHSFFYLFTIVGIRSIKTQGPLSSLPGNAQLEADSRWSLCHFCDNYWKIITANTLVSFLERSQPLLPSAFCSHPVNTSNMRFSFSWPMSPKWSPGE